MFFKKARKSRVAGLHFEKTSQNFTINLLIFKILPVVVDEHTNNCIELI